MTTSTGETLTAADLAVMALAKAEDAETALAGLVQELSVLPRREEHAAILTSLTSLRELVAESHATCAQLSAHQHALESALAECPDTADLARIRAELVGSLEAVATQRHGLAEVQAMVAELLRRPSPATVASPSGVDHLDAVLAAVAASRSDQPQQWTFAIQRDRQGRISGMTAEAV